MHACIMLALSQQRGLYLEQMEHIFASHTIRDPLITSELDLHQLLPPTHQSIRYDLPITMKLSTAITVFTAIVIGTANAKERALRRGLEGAVSANHMNYASVIVPFFYCTHTSSYH